MNVGHGHGINVSLRWVYSWRFCSFFLIEIMCVSVIVCPSSTKHVYA